MSEHSAESGLFIEDLKLGLVLPGGALGRGLAITPEAFEARFGRLFWRPTGGLDPVYFKLVAFCKTTAVSENSPANLGARNVLFRRAPASLELEATTTVLGRKFRAPGADTGVCQVQSVIGAPGEDPVLSWTRECIVNGRRGWRLADDGAPLDDREKITTCFDPATARLPQERPEEQPGEAAPAALAAEDFRVGETIPTAYTSVLQPDDIFWLTRGLGNLAKTHYTRSSGYIVWGLLTLLYGVRNYAEQLSACLLVGLDVAKHIAPVYLSEKLRSEDANPAHKDEPPEHLSATLTTREVSDWPGQPGVKLVTADLAVYNNVNAIGRAEYERQQASKALAAITDDNRLQVGDYRLKLAAFEGR